MDLPFDEDDGDDDGGALVAPTHPPDPNRMAALACQSLHLGKISISQRHCGPMGSNTYHHIQADR